MKDINNPHFDKIYWFIILITVFSFAYITAVTFFVVPKENQQTVNIVTGTILGTIITAGISYLLVGSPTLGSSKKSVIPENSDTDISITSTSNKNNESTT